MKKSFINLRPHDHFEIKHTQIRIRNRYSILKQLSKQSVTIILSYLRLAEIVTFYESLKFSHKHQQLKRLVLNYLILTSRNYTKYEEKEFLDLIIEKMNKKKRQKSRDTNKVFFRDINNNFNIEYTTTVSCRSISDRFQLANNDRSRMIKLKESIVYDVDRTYLRKISSNNLKTKLPIQALQESSNKTKNKSVSQNIRSQKVHSQQSEVYPFFYTVPDSSLKSTFSSKGRMRYSQSNHNCGQQIHSQSSRIQYTQLQKMQNYLKNVLLRISQKYSSLGYIQGFNYIVKNMYLTGYEEEEAETYLSYFIEQKNLDKIIMNKMLGIRKLSYVLKVYIYNYVPKVYKHFIKSELEPQVFCTSWFITLFSQDLNTAIVNKLWHLFYLEGWKIFIQFGVALLCAYQSEIQGREVDEIFTFMRRIMEKFNQQTKKKSHKNKADQQNSRKDQMVWKLMTSIDVNRKILRQLCHQMVHLQNDCQIEIWRLQNDSKAESSRSIGSCSQKSLLSSYQSTQNCQSFGYQNVPRFCCDKISYDTNLIKNDRQKRSNIFFWCHSVDTLVD